MFVVDQQIELRFQLINMQIISDGKNETAFPVDKVNYRQFLAVKIIVVGKIYYNI